MMVSTLTIAPTVDILLLFEDDVKLSVIETAVRWVVVDIGTVVADM